MYIKSISVDNFKNLSGIRFNADKDLNVICGENAQGKTNLIEAIYLCTGLKSFRNTKDKNFFNFDSDSFHINLSFCDKQREQNISYSMAKQLGNEKNVTLNGVKLSVPSKLFGNLNCVIFTPDDLELSKGSPENRRKFLDLCVSQIKNSYQSVLNNYDTILLQRNTLLKKSQGNIDKTQLEVWDEQLASLGSYISVLRYTYTKKLNIFAAKLYNEIADGREKLELFYESSVFDTLSERTDYNETMKQDYLEKLEGSLENDIKAGFTTVGIHRDDLVSKINGLNSREYCSQGQNRSIALIYKLSQAFILGEEREDLPVILLDDVLSELDKKRQKFILEKIDGIQVFITTCDKESVKNYKSKTINIKDGKMV